MNIFNHFSIFFINIYYSQSGIVDKLPMLLTLPVIFDYSSKIALNRVCP